MSDSSDDSGADSDIGAKMEQIHNQQLLRQQQQQQQDDSDDDDSDDDDDEDCAGEMVLLRAARRTTRTSTKRGGGSSVDVKLQKLEHSQAVRERRHRLQQQASKRRARSRQNEEDYSSSSSDDDEIQIVDAPAARKVAKKTKYSSAVDSSVDIDDDSEDDSDTADDAKKNSNAHDDQAATTTPRISERASRAVARRQQQRCTSLQDLQQRGILLKEEDAQELQKLSAAKAQLENASNRRSVLSPLATYRRSDDDEVEVLDDAPTPAQTLHLNVHATVRHKKDERLVEQKQAAVTVQDTQSAQEVLNLALQQWQYDPASGSSSSTKQSSSSIGVLKYNDKTLQNRFALAMHGIPAYGAVLHADITLLDNNCGGGSGKRPAAANVGKLIRVTLRNGASQNVVMKVGEKEPLQQLVERYQKQQNCSVQRLLFDGEALPLHTTPAAHDMEDEDLIDVVLS